jgi:hypothetical protein
MKGKEGLVQKRTGSTQRGRMGCNFCGLLDNYVCVRYSSDALASVQLGEYAGYDSLYDMIVHRTRWSKLERLVIMLGCRFESETGLCVCEVAVGVTVKLYYVCVSVWI